MYIRKPISISIYETTYEWKSYIFLWYWKILSEKYQEKALPVIKENLEKICELKNKEYKIYFLSNITDVSYNYLNDKLNILDMVDGGKYDR